MTCHICGRAISVDERGPLCECAEKLEAYREALEHIVKHVRITAGDMAPISGTYVIATKALSR